MKLAAKLLSAVEVSADASHQHEFHAGTLRRVLDLPEAASGQLDIVYLRDDEETDQETCSFTLYDAREGRPRAAEYRLYFSSNELQRNASEGDILIVVRGVSTSELKCLVISRASEAGSAIASILESAGVELGQKFSDIGSYLQRSEVAGLLEATAEPSVVRPPEDMLPLADEAFIRSVLQRGVLPDTRTMARQAGHMIERFVANTPDPDDFLAWSLEAETALFNHLEKLLAQLELDALQQRGVITFADATVVVLRRLQARRSRRGQSLQHHFRALLTMHRIPHGEQCSTESGERPDFIVPGCAEYADATYPSQRLRMIACKSTLRDRWGQILKEAERINEKYLLTVDPRITEDLAARVVAKRVLLFVPQPVITAVYTDTPIEKALRNVRQLVDRLAAA